MANKEKNYSLINAREELGLNRLQISKEIGIPIMVYGSYEANRMDPPKETQDKIVNFFQDNGLLVSQKYLFQKNYKGETILKKGDLEFDF
jgi:DNA-binding XRE family transcriptional regulator